MNNKNNKNSKPGEIPASRLKEMAENTIKQNPKVFERLAEI